MMESLSEAWREPHPWARVDGDRSDPLHLGWELAPSPPGAYDTAGAAMAAALPWRPAVVPGTVADSLGLDLDGTSDLDGEDWWYRCVFPEPTLAPGERARLRFDGLATLAEVWLNGTLLFTSRNMFLPRCCEVSELLREDNDLVLCFRSLATELAVRRPRPRWKTALVTQQNLRWVRTTLLGRIPGWTPAIPPVGPWRAVTLERVRRLEIRHLDLQTEAIGTEARVSLAAEIQTLDGSRISSATLQVGSHTFQLAVEQGQKGTRLSGDVIVPGVPLWWPHTHGAPNRLDCTLHLETDAGAVLVDCGPIGFKAVAMDREDGRVQLVVNGRPVFCRGACWTVNDFRSLSGDPKALRQSLTLARDAGVNMLRVGGTMIYESDLFYSLCDELGILVWQDFMFANMDYPFADAAFHDEVEREVTHQLGRLQRHPCLALYCGGSEIEQQAAMLGLPVTEWSNAFFSDELPRLCAARHRGIPYFPSTPTEGVLPFHPSTGISHYYGVGAYRRPLQDVKHARVKFTSECLGFSNVPDGEAMEQVFGDARPVPHHPRWKAGVPRDSGAGWDFEDIRDHYLKALFGLDPIELRSRDPERYFAVSRAVTGEVMRAVFSEWRRPGCGCGGGLVWFFKDLRPGAGWGLLDSAGRPKAAYWFLKRAWARQTLLMTDEGLEGLHLHLLNETDKDLHGLLELDLLQGGRIPAGHAEQEVSVPAHGATTVAADALFSSFSDLTYAYRFGPPKHDVVIGRLKSPDGRQVLAEDCHFPLGWNLPFQEPAGISTTSAQGPEGRFTVTIESPVFLQTVALSCQNHAPDDNYFHLAPGQQKQIQFSPRTDPAAPFRAELSALNLRESVPLRVNT
jgi:beta-mannosidase